jgi:fructan beta-fructosidase
MAVLYGFLCAALVFLAPPSDQRDPALYHETYRPQFHFTPARNWMNDPNGLVYYSGEYHLFFQHNPSGRQWGNMTWGHAVSRDLVHWRQLPNAIQPDRLGTIFSGSAVVDAANTAGFKSGKESPLVCIYTSAGKPFTQSIAYSNDRGRSWTKYAKNPVLNHIAGDNRDPKVFWHKPTKKWVMALYLDGNRYALFGSPNLKVWTKLCDVPMPGCAECPDFFPLAVDGDPHNVRWIFWAANGRYRIGSFDGQTFKPETAPLQSLWGANDYAAQTYNNIPSTDGRRIQIAWMNGGVYPDMPFNQQMTFPRELTLPRTTDGFHLCMRPVREISRLYAKKHNWNDLTLKPGTNPLAGLRGELWDIETRINLQDAKEVTLTVRGVPIHYDCRKAILTCLGRSAPVPLTDGMLKLRVLVDRTSIEIFAADGRVTMCSCFVPNLSNRSLALFVKGGQVRARSLKVTEIRSAWK